MSDGASGFDIAGIVGGVGTLLGIAGAGIKSLFRRADRREAALDRKEAELVARMETRVAALEKRDEEREAEMIELRAELQDTRTGLLILAQEVSATNPASPALMLARKLLRDRFPLDGDTPPDMREALRQI